MIIGIGTDLIEIERVKKACEKEAFLTRYFTSDEIAMFQGRASRMAGNFAVKESVSKVFGTGFRTMSLDEIEVLRDALGKPYIRLHGEAERIADALGIKKLHVSITNTKVYASAYVIGES